METCFEQNLRILIPRTHYYLCHILSKPSYQMDSLQKHITCFFLQTYSYYDCICVHDTRTQIHVRNHMTVLFQIIPNMVNCLLGLWRASYFKLLFLWLLPKTLHSFLTETSMLLQHLRCVCASSPLAHSAEACLHTLSNVLSFFLERILPNT